MVLKEKKRTYLTKLRDIEKFAFYVLRIYLKATFSIGCLSLMIGSSILRFPCDILISNPIVWVLVVVAFAVTYKFTVKHLTSLVRGIFEEEKKMNQKEQKNLYCHCDVKLSENEQNKKKQIKTYSTIGDGNCFFHAVFGNSISGQYRAEKAQEMRLEWYKFLSQFTSLNDASMPAPLRAQLITIFNLFLDKPEDLTGKSDKIKRLVEHTNNKIKKIGRRVEKLIKKLLCIGFSENEVKSNLKDLAVMNLFSAKRYDKSYNSEITANSLLKSELIYKFYLEAIRSQSYHIFMEEIPVLASLANVEIDIYYQDNSNDVRIVFKPNQEMINKDYYHNNGLWKKNRERKIIYLKLDHYEKAELLKKNSDLLI